MRELALCVLLAISLTASAGEQDYQCVVTGEAFLGSNGTIGSGNRPVYVSQRFAIDRRSGAITGGPMASNAETGVRFVLDPGGPGWSYKLVSTYKPGPDGHRAADYIVVNEFEKGEVKPFVGLTGSMVIHGTCE
jgi:hypothetical protein